MQSDKPPDPEDGGVVQDVDWADYRDHLATADAEGHRRWLYPKKPQGRWYRRRAWVSWLLLAIMFAGPFIRIQGNPLLMINILERRFSILGQIFWPQDTIIFAVAMLAFIMGIIVFTTAFGRLWCGWTCPQTVLMEMVFRKIEYWIEGDAPAQRALNAAPWTARKWFRKLLKHGVFFALSFLIGNTLLSYIIGSDELLKIIRDPVREHWVGLSFMLLFTLLFYALFARFREQACTFICPYGRFQSAMLDENTMVVAYDHKRGEKRAPWRRDQEIQARQEAGLGDCIGCRQCVVVCPTGIDIRDGTQMECVNCTACIDACDAVMDKIERPRGLIRFASFNNIEQGTPQQFTPRMAMYGVFLAGLITLFLVLTFTRSDVETTFLRAPGSLYQTTAEGRISNLYTVKVINKTLEDMPVMFLLNERPGVVRVLGADQLTVAGGQLAQTSVLIELEPDTLEGSKTPLEISVVSGDQVLETVDTVFIGPRTKTIN